MNNNNCFETPVPVKYLIACTTEKLLFINNSQILLRPPGKKPLQGPPPRKLPCFGAPPFGISVALRGGGCGGGGGGVGILWS